MNIRVEIDRAAAHKKNRSAAVAPLCLQGHRLLEMCLAPRTRERVADMRTLDAAHELGLELQWRGRMSSVKRLVVSVYI